MNEAFLHYVWQHKKYKEGSLVTADGHPVEVHHPGTYNRDAGPDFFNARITIGGSTWAGNVELHVSASEWNRHRHQLDPLYSNCILHVVWNHDLDVSGMDGKVIPVLVLKDKLQPGCFENYVTLMKREDVIACSDQLGELEERQKGWWLERMTVERLEKKSNAFRQLLELTNWNWEEAFFIAIARNYGFNINADPFERLVRSVPFSLLLRLRDRHVLLEALLLGQAGFLGDQKQDHYIKRLQEEYVFLQHKYGLIPVPDPGWKFMRLRPSNFPTLRIAQLAALLRDRTPLFSQCMEADTLEQLMAIFHNPVSPYWQSHYRPGVTAVGIHATMGEQSVRLLLINTVVPFLFLRGKKEGNIEIGEKALWWLRFLLPEDNAIIRAWKSVGWKAENAAQSQGLIQLYSSYCSNKKCLFCQLGHLVVSGDTMHLEASSE